MYLCRAGVSTYCDNEATAPHLSLLRKMLAPDDARAVVDKHVLAVHASWFCLSTTDLHLPGQVYAFISGNPKEAQLHVWLRQAVGAHFAKLALQHVQFSSLHASKKPAGAESHDARFKRESDNDARREQRRCALVNLLTVITRGMFPGRCLQLLLLLQLWWRWWRP